MDTLQERQKIWVEQADGSMRAGIFVGEAAGSWFGGSPGAYVAYPDTHSGEQVAIMRIVPRDEDKSGLSSAISQLPSGWRRETIVP